MSIERTVPQFFTEWRSDWTVSAPWIPVHYLDQPEGLRTTLMAQWLFSPELIEYRNGVFRVDRFSPESIDGWLDGTPHGIATVEEVVNRANMWDVFEHVDLDDFQPYLPDLTETLRKCWTGTLLAAFPDRHFTVETATEDDGSYGPSVTFYSTPPDEGISGR